MFRNCWDFLKNCYCHMISKTCSECDAVEESGGLETVLPLEWQMEEPTFEEKASRNTVEHMERVYPSS